MFYIDENGNIELVQGDSGKMKVKDLETDRNYTVYLAIQDSNRKPVGGEISVSTNQSDNVTLDFTPSLTNLLTVKKNEDTAEYTYSIKVCYPDDNYEDTLFIGDSLAGKITVYPKKVEGTANG